MTEVVLAVLVVALVAAIVTLAVVTIRQARGLVENLHDNAELVQAMGDAWRQDFARALRDAELQNRAERALFLRAVLARNGQEFGQLDRIRQAESRTAVASEREYVEWLERDLRAGLGADPTDPLDPNIPLVPEGMGG